MTDRVRGVSKGIGSYRWHHPRAGARDRSTVQCSPVQDCSYTVNFPANLVYTLWNRGWYMIQKTQRMWWDSVKNTRRVATSEAHFAMRRKATDTGLNSRRRARTLSRYLLVFDVQAALSKTHKAFSWVNVVSEPSRSPSSPGPGFFSTPPMIRRCSILDRSSTLLMHSIAPGISTSLTNQCTTWFPPHSTVF